MPDVLLKTVDIIVRAMVPPNVEATAITGITVAIYSGKKPTECKLPRYYELESGTHLWEHMHVPGINRSPVPAPVSAIIP